jgi:surface polysaccharide O-acyltransferase-like enzyme
MLILYHSGMGYVPWGWHVKNNELSEAFIAPMQFLNRWRLPLLFFVSGCGVAFSLRRRTLSEFRSERLRRLGLPVLFGIFVIVPPQIYLERLAGGATFAYAEFYPSVFQFVAYPKGSTSWHHLWFVVYVLVYALATIPLYGRLRRFAGMFGDWVSVSPWRIYTTTIPNLVVALTLGPRFPTTHALIGDWANLLGAWLTFCWGFVFASNERLLDLVQRRRAEFFIAALAATALFFATSGFARELGSGYMGFAWIMTLVGFSRQWVRTDSPTLRYTTEAVFPFYIVHQTITVALVYWMKDWALAIFAKWLIAATATFAGSLVMYEAVKRVRLLRPCFGLR